MRRLLKSQALERFFSVLASILLIMMMVLIFSNIALRYLFRSYVPGTIELTEFIMVFIVYFTLAHTQALKENISVKIITDLMSIRRKSLLELVASLLALFLFILITWQGFMAAREAFLYEEVTEGIIEFPVFPAKCSVPIGGLLLCRRYLLDIVEIATELFSGETNDDS